MIYTKIESKLTWHGYEIKYKYINLSENLDNIQLDMEKISMRVTQITLSIKKPLFWLCSCSKQNDYFSKNEKTNQSTACNKKFYHCAQSIVLEENSTAKDEMPAQKQVNIFLFIIENSAYETKSLHNNINALKPSKDSKSSIMWLPLAVLMLKMVFKMKE